MTGLAIVTGSRGSFGTPAAGTPVLDAGVCEVPATARRIAARELLPAPQAQELLERTRNVVTGWHGGARAGRAIETSVLLPLAHALRALVLVRRFAAAAGVRQVRHLGPLPEGDLLAGVLHGEGIALEIRVGATARLRAVAARTRARLTGRPAAAPPAPARRGPGLRTWGLATYRNEPVLEALAADGRLSLRRWVRGAENRYLPATGAAARPSAPDLAALDEACARWLPDVPGAPLLARRIVGDALARELPGFAGEVRSWERALDDDPPLAIVAGIAWAGDLRTLAIVAAERGVPFVSCQDGLLAEVGAGGVPVGSDALCWGPLGARWFEARGFRRALAIGDPWMDRLVRDVEAMPRGEARRALGIGPDARVLLAGVANSAPHLLHAEPLDPLRQLEELLAGTAGTGVVVLVKPHPRLPLVDGRRRLDEVERRVAGAPHARLRPPDDPLPPLMAAADAQAGEGDTLGFEMVRCGRAAIVLLPGDLMAPYPELVDTGTMPRARDAGELRALLARGIAPPPPAAARALLDLHLRREHDPAAAVVALASRVPAGSTR